MRLKFNDASTQDVRLPVQIWTRTDRYLATIPVSRPVVGVVCGPTQCSRLECVERHVGDRLRPGDVKPVSTGRRNGSANSSGPGQAVRKWRCV